MKARVLTALVGIPVVLGIVGCENPWPLAVLIVIVAGICGKELAEILGAPMISTFFAGVLLTAIGLPFAFAASPPGGTAATLALVVLLYAIGVSACLLAAKAQAGKGLLAGLGCLWIALPLLSLLYLHPNSLSAAIGWKLPMPILMALLPVWAGDIAAMFAGMAFGKHALAPKISPKKTWEGAIANFAAASATGWAVGAWLGYETWVGISCGMAIGFFGQIGDLFESGLKRMGGVKDSGSLLPGHGGLLDRIDALLGSAIPVWFILLLSGSV